MPDVRRHDAPARQRSDGVINRSSIAVEGTRPPRGGFNRGQYVNKK
jgi:hypothetical protein